MNFGGSRLGARTRKGRWLAVGLSAALISGCAGIRYASDYSSEIRHEPLPLRSTVTVLVSPALREEMEDDPARLEGLRQMYQAALKRDLQTNGPLTPVVDDPEARLQVTLLRVEAKELPLAVMMWFVAPTWLFGVPFYWARVDLEAEVLLTSAWGDVLYRATVGERCKRLQGLYYGHEALSFGCPGRKIAERVRDQVSLNRSDVLARYASSRARNAPARASRPPPPPPRGPVRPSMSDLKPIGAAPAGPAPVAAVFNIRDMSGQFSPQLLDQLTEYLSAQIASRLRYKIVPRNEIRGQLAENKADSYRACYDEGCQIEVGKALAASKSVSTTLLRVGSRCAFTATIYDLRTEAADRAASAQTSCDEDALLDGVERVVRGLAAR